MYILTSCFKKISIEINYELSIYFSYILYAYFIIFISLHPFYLLYLISNIHGILYNNEICYVPLLSLPSVRVYHHIYYHGHGPAQDETPKV